SSPAFLISCSPAFLLSCFPQRQYDPPSPSIPAHIRSASPRWGARVVEWTGLENRRGLRVTVGSNPTPTASRGTSHLPSRWTAVRAGLPSADHPDRGSG